MLLALYNVMYSLHIRVYAFHFTKICIIEEKLISHVKHDFVKNSKSILATYIVSHKNL